MVYIVENLLKEESMKKLSILSIFFILLMVFTITVNSVEGYEFSPTFIALERHKCDLNINNGIASSTGDAMCSDGYTVRITIYLQRYINNSWATINSWNGDKDIYSFVNEISAVSYGYKYRVKSVATVYDNNVIEAPVLSLPDQYVKFANIDWWNDIPDTVEPYYSNPPYTVNLRCKKVGQPEYCACNILVRESGPWNISDNYWDSATASNPRRVFTDLPLGIPEAERAYLQNYNNGKDESGREVLTPAGIDLSFSVADELGLGYLENVWLEVYYSDLP